MFDPPIFYLKQTQKKNEILSIFHMMDLGGKKGGGKKLLRKEKISKPLKKFSLIAFGDSAYPHLLYAVWTLPVEMNLYWQTNGSYLLEVMFLSADCPDGWELIPEFGKCFKLF